MFDVLPVLKWISPLLTLPVISFLMNFFYMRNKDIIQYVERFSIELKKDNIDCHFIEILFRKIYKTRYVSSEEIMILMKQKNPSRTSFLYAQINRFIKITELKDNNGSISFDFSHGLKKKRQRCLWSGGLLFLGTLLYIAFIYFLDSSIDSFYHYENYNTDERINVFMLCFVTVLTFCFVILLFILGLSILYAKYQTKKINDLMFCGE